MKKDFIIAYRWMYGATHTQANTAWKKWDDSMKRVLIAAWKNNATKTFYND